MLEHPILTLLTLTLTLPAHTLAPPRNRPNVFHITAKPEKVPSHVEFTYPGTGLDGPAVRPVNATTFDWVRIPIGKMTTRT